MGRTVGGLLAIETSIRATAKRAETDAYHRFQKPALLAGYSKTYEARNAEATEWDVPPNEGVLVQVDAEDVVRDVAREMAKWFNITATRDLTNSRAVADIEVDGTVLLEKVPIAYLMFLERVLVDLMTFVSKLPVLDPAESWQRTEGSTVWASTPVVSQRTEKIPHNHVIARATDKFAEQVQVYYTDDPVGKWTRIKFSGALPAQRVADMVGRVRALQESVKLARDEANRTPVVTDLQESGSKVFEYVLG